MIIFCITLVWVLSGIVAGQSRIFNDHDSLIGLNLKSPIYLILSGFFGLFEVRTSIKYNKLKKDNFKLESEIYHNDIKEFGESNWPETRKLQTSLFQRRKFWSNVECKFLK
jgi:hypothetical protein